MKQESRGADQAEDRGEEEDRMGIWGTWVKWHRLHFVLNPPQNACQSSVAFLHQSKSWTAVGKPEVRAEAAGATWRLRTQESTAAS